MKSYFFEWHSSLMMSDYLVLRGGIGAVASQKIYQLARTEGIQIDFLHVSPVGIRLLASSDPSALIEATERHLREVRVNLRTSYRLLSQAVPQPA